MSYLIELEKVASKKNTLVEIDTPLDATWLNYKPGIWFTTLSPGSALVEDDNGNFGYWGEQNDTYFNINSLNIGGELYTEVNSIAEVIATERTWFYDTDTTRMYIRFEDWKPPAYFIVVAPGAVIGFSFQIDNEANNYFEDIYYEPLLLSIPNLTKKKDTLFYGILQYTGGTLTFDNTGGYFDDFATRDLYGQPVRIRLTFEGLDYSDSEVVYTGRVEDFAHDMETFKLNVADVRKLLSRKLPVNLLSLGDYPDMNSRLDGTPIPIVYGTVIKAQAYKVTDTGGTETFVFADTTFNAIDSGISVYDKNDASVATGGTETDGTFTTSSSEDKLYVTFTQSSIQNGLDIISDILENYEDVTYNSTNYDTTEWEYERDNNVVNEGIWIGKGRLMSSVDVIEKVCTDNQGIFDVLEDGRFTFRTFDYSRIPIAEIQQDELLDDVPTVYESDEYVSSVEVQYSEDLKEREYIDYTNTEFEAEVFGRYRQHKEKVFKTYLMSQADAITLSDDVMEQSKFIYPGLRLTTKTQYIGLRILDSILFTHQRQDGSIIIPRSRYQVLGIVKNLSGYEIGITIKQITEDDTDYTAGTVSPTTLSSGILSTSTLGGI